MDIVFQLKNSTLRNQVFCQAMLRKLYLTSDGMLPLRTAQEAGVEALEERRWSVSDATITAWTRKLKHFDLFTYQKKGRANIMVLTEKDKLLDIIEEFLELDLDVELAKEQFADLKVPVRLSKERRVDKALFTRYMKAFYAGEVDMAFIKPKEKKNV